MTPGGAMTPGGGDDPLTTRVASLEARLKAARRRGVRGRCKRQR